MSNPQNEIYRVMSPQGGSTGSYRSTSTPPIHRVMGTAVTPTPTYTTSTTKILGATRPGTTMVTSSPSSNVTRSSPLAPYAGLRTATSITPGFRAAPRGPSFQPVPPRPPRLESSMKKHRRGRRPVKRDRGCLQNMLCLDERRGAGSFKMPDWLTTTMRRRAPSYEFHHHNRIVSVDTDDWDELSERAWQPAREGPLQGRAADELAVTVRDVFPCLMPIFNACGCGEPRRQRVQVRPRHAAARGPQLETVCLECGHVLHHHQLPGTLPPGVCTNFRDQYNWNTLGGDFNTHSRWEELDKDAGSEEGLEGYKDWTLTHVDRFGRVISRGDFNRARKYPLPVFQEAPAREFRKVVSNSRDDKSTGGYPDLSDMYATDVSGRVDLPKF